MSQHTPGPWKVEPAPAPREGHYWIRSIVPQRGLQGKHAIAETIPDAVPYDEAKANARLIAAAPEMMALLRDWLEWYEGAIPKDHRDEYETEHLMSCTRSIIARMEMNDAPLASPKHS